MVGWSNFGVACQDTNAAFRRAMAHSTALFTLAHHQ
jgi:hypothetical protein